MVYAMLILQECAIIGDNEFPHIIVHSFLKVLFPIGFQIEADCMYIEIFLYVKFHLYILIESWSG